MKRFLPALLLGALGSCAGATHQPAENALGPYSASVVSGRLVFVSGQVGRERESFAAEVSSCLDAVERELHRAGADLGDLVAVTVYLTDMEDYAAFNEVYAERLPAPYPSRACVAVSALPGGARVEIQATAVLD